MDGDVSVAGRVTESLLTTLQKRAELDPSLLKTLKKSKLDSSFKYAENAYFKALDYERNGDIQSAYICGIRAGIICGLMKDHMTAEYRRSDGHRFVQFFNNVVARTERYADVLQERQREIDEKRAFEIAKEIEAQRFGSNKATVIPAEAPKTNSLYITAKELYQLADRKAKVLIIDYRNNPKTDINLSDVSNSVCIAHIDRDSMSEKMTAGCLPSYTILKDRSFVESSKLSTYDRIVLMDDDQPETAGNSPGSFTGHARMLYAALTTYAYNIRLRSEPVFLEKGYDAWTFSYPQFTTESYQLLDVTAGDTFENVMQQMLSTSTTLMKNVEYADLSNTFAKPQLQPQAQVFPPEEPKRFAPTVFPSQSEPAILRPPPPPVPPTQPPRAVAPPIPAPRTIPAPPTAPVVPNRSTKPASLSSSSSSTVTVNQQPRIQPNEPAIDNGFYASYPPAPKALISAPPPPPPSTVVHPPPSSALQTPSSVRQPHGLGIPPRPPTPDRSTKVLPISPDVEKRLVRLHESALHRFHEASRGTRNLASSPGPGFVNIGNTCFMNTTLQAVIHTPFMYELFSNEKYLPLINETNKLSTKGGITTVFAALLDVYYNTSAAVINPSFFLDSFSSMVNSRLADRRQHDAQEFQIYLLDALHEDTNRVRQRKPFEQDYDGSNLVQQAEDYDIKARQFSASPIADLFNLRTISTISCSICDVKSVTFEEVTQISLELHCDSGVPSLSDCLKRHFRQEILTDDSKWYCPKCRRLQTAKKEYLIWSLPKTLVVHLKRFSQHSSGYSKNEVHVRFQSDSMPLNDFVHPQSPAQKVLYRLYAVTNHCGSLNSGHYTSLINSNQRWYKFDDDTVSEISSDHIETSKAFVLFYKAL